MKKFIITESEKNDILNQYNLNNKSNLDLVNLSISDLKKKLDLPNECKVEIKKGDSSTKKYSKYVKYIITNLPSPVDENRTKIMKKIKSFDSENLYFNVKPNFGKGINWMIKY